MHTQELVSKCLQNQASAQKMLYDAYAPTMLGVCYRYTKNSEEASDVLQEGFIKVFTHLHQWKGDGELGGWIRRIMVNTALNWIRSHRKMHWEPEDQITETTNSPLPTTPADSLQAKQLANLIRQMPCGYQTVFNLHAVEGYSHIEIGQMLGISESTSRSQYLRARRLMMEKINALELKNEFDYGYGK